MEHRITIQLSSESIQAAIQQIQDYKTWLEQKCTELSARLADMGLKSAQAIAAGARLEYFTLAGKDADGHKTWKKFSVPADVSFKVEPSENGFRIVAGGDDICFIEFGAGVYHNGAESYPGERPPGIVGIGQYGAGHGMQEWWWVVDKLGTNGTPTMKPMWEAAYEMRSRIEEVAREVFTS